MTPTPPLVRFCAVAAPGLLLPYGLLRLVDGWDGDHGPGLAWNLGHSLFFVAFVLFGVLAVALRRLIPPAGTGAPIIASTATVAALLGAACFLWVILGDLFARIDEVASLPDPLMVAGPLLFQLGVLTLLVQLAIIRPRRLPGWSPPLVVVGFVTIAIDLDLLPIAAGLLAAGLAPLAVPRREALHLSS